MQVEPLPESFRFDILPWGTVALNLDGLLEDALGEAVVERDANAEVEGEGDADSGGEVEAGVGLGKRNSHGGGSSDIARGGTEDGEDR